MAIRTMVIAEVSHMAARIGSPTVRRRRAGATAKLYSPAASPNDPASMFESLTQRLSGTIERLRCRGRLSESNISDALREVRNALLEADVAPPVGQAGVQRIQVRAVAPDVLKSQHPRQALIRSEAPRVGKEWGST